MDEMRKNNAMKKVLISDVWGIIVNVKINKIIYIRLISELQIDYVENILKKYSEIEISKFG